MICRLSSCSFDLSFKALSPRWFNPPLLGFVRFSPLRRSPVWESTPRDPKTPFGRAEPPARSCSAFAVSHRLDGLLLPCGAGLSHPAADHEVRRVSSVRRPATTWVVPGLCPSSSRRGFTPFEGSPSSAAAPRHRGRCPLGVSLVPRPLTTTATLTTGIVLASAWNPRAPGHWLISTEVVICPAAWLGAEALALPALRPPLAPLSRGDTHLPCRVRNPTRDTLPPKRLGGILSRVSGFESGPAALRRGGRGSRSAENASIPC